MFAKESILSGFFAATAATLGKVALSRDSFIISLVSNIFGTAAPAYYNLVINIDRTFQCSDRINSVFTHQIEPFCRLIVFALMMASNALMLAFFLDALEKENSTLMVTAVSTSVNFVSTGVIGNLLFSEEVSLAWYGGALLTSGGAALVSYSQKSHPIERNKPI